LLLLCVEGPTTRTVSDPAEVLSRRQPTWPAQRWLMRHIRLLAAVVDAPAGRVAAVTPTAPEFEGTV
jgi:hypothetical protein